jgi:hypothetical protein
VEEVDRVRREAVVEARGLSKGERMREEDHMTRKAERRDGRRERLGNKTTTAGSERRGVDERMTVSRGGDEGMRERGGSRRGGG